MLGRCKFCLHPGPSCLSRKKRVSRPFRLGHCLLGLATDTAERRGACSCLSGTRYRVARTLEAQREASNPLWLVPSQTTYLHMYVVSRLSASGGGTARGLEGAGLLAASGFGRISPTAGPEHQGGRYCQWDCFFPSKKSRIWFIDGRVRECPTNAKTHVGLDSRIDIIKWKMYTLPRGPDMMDNWADQEKPTMSQDSGTALLHARPQTGTSVSYVQTT